MEIINLKTNTEHIQRVVDILISMGSPDYLLMVSGGRTPAQLYKHLSISFNYPFPKDIAFTDERWGEKKEHAYSNELAIQGTGFFGRARWEKSKIHSVLSEYPSNPRVEASGYGEELSSLFLNYHNRVVAIMTMGADGRTAGILPNSQAIEASQNVIAYTSDEHFRARITVTAKCIMESLHNIILLVNTEEKCAMFDRIMSRETDMNKFPILVYKSHPNVTAFCYK